MTYPVLCVKQPVKENFTKAYLVAGYTYSPRCHSRFPKRELLFVCESLMDARIKLWRFLEHEKNFVKSMPCDFPRYGKLTIESCWKSTPKEEYKIVPEVFYVEQ